MTTPFGDVAIFASASDGVVRVSGFGSLHEVALRHPRVLDGSDWTAGDHPDAATAVAAWAEGEVQALRAVAVAQPGGPFMQAAWAQLRDVPAGEVITYHELAERAGSPRAMRAAGQACARNGLAPFVPCHRVVAADGIGNYGYGVGLKRSLLVHEGAPPDQIR